VSFHSHTWVQPTQVAQMLGDFRHHGAAQKLINMETISLATTETVMSTRVLLLQPHLPQPAQPLASSPSNTTVLFTMHAPTQEDSKTLGAAPKLTSLVDTLLVTMQIVVLVAPWRSLVKI